MYVEHHKILQNLDSLEPAKIPEVHIKDKETKRIKKKKVQIFFKNFYILATTCHHYNDDSCSCNHYDI